MLPFGGFKTVAMFSKVEGPLEDHGSDQGKKNQLIILSNSLDPFRQKLFSFYLSNDGLSDATPFYSLGSHGSKSYHITVLV